MRSTLLAVLAALFFTDASAQDAPSNFEILQNICVEGRGSADRTLQRAREQGWTDIQTSADARLEAALRLSQALTQGEGQFLALGARRLLVSHNGARVGCFVFDFDAAERPDDLQITAWLNAPPTARQYQDTGLNMVRWDSPTALDRTVGVGAIFLAPQSEASAALGMNGVMLAVVSFPD